MDGGYTLRTRKVMTNKLLHRLQMVIDVIHPNLGGVSKDKLKERLAKTYKSKPENVVVYGLRTVFGGSRSTGFALIYDSKDVLQKYECKYVLRRLGTLPARTGSRKQKRELKNKRKKVRGTAKKGVGLGKKK
jgi:small subunit ribosomal protein S24e